MWFLRISCFFTQNFLDPKSFRPKIFWTLNFFAPKIFCEHNVFLRTIDFFLAQIFFNPIFQTHTFIGPTFFQTQNIFRTKNLFYYPKIFMDLNCFGSKIVRRTKFFVGLNFFGLTTTTNFSETLRPKDLETYRLGHFHQRQSLFMFP